MKKFIAISDIHLGWKLFNLPELAEDLKDNFVRVCDLAIQLQVNYLFVVGDLFDTNRPSPDLVAFVRNQVKRLRNKNICIAGIAGDHDKPVNGTAWYQLTGITPINELDEEEFIGFDYTDNSADNIQKLVNLPDKTKVNWVFLHGQVPELFPFCEDKKKLDIKSLDSIKTFPNLKGFILGDIHNASSGNIEDPAMQRPNQWIGYCGSLGIIKTDEIDNKEGVLYFDGDELQRLPFKLDRQFIRLNLGESLEPINWVEKYAKFYTDNPGKKPVFLVEYARDQKQLLPNIDRLYEVGIVKVSMTRVIAKSTEKETINIRSELKTNDRIESTLKECAQEQEVFDLVLKMLNTEDPKMILDEFKKETLEVS